MDQPCDLEPEIDFAIRKTYDITWRDIALLGLFMYNNTFSSKKVYRTLK